MFPTRTHPEGVDVSVFQGVFPWDTWKSHISFGMAKAAEGGFLEDPQFERNWKQMHDKDLYRFAYNVVHPDESEPVIQATHFASTVLKYPSYTGDCIVMDFETGLDDISVIDAAFWAWSYMTILGKLMPHHRSLVYIDDNLIEKGYAARLGAWHLWVAQYGVPEPQMPLGPWEKATFWQYSATVVDRDRYLSGAHNLHTFCTEAGN